MAHEFCEHLDDYGVLFGRAKASYENCLHIMDKIIEEIDESNLRRILEKALDEWVLETRRMQNSFADLVKNGSIGMAGAADPSESLSLEGVVPTCGDCGFQVPRLVFSEFDLTENQNPKFRGTELPLPQEAGF